MTRGAARFPAIVIALAAAATLAGCQTASDMLEGKKVDYKSAGSLPPSWSATGCSAGS